MKKEFYLILLLITACVPEVKKEKNEENKTTETSKDTIAHLSLEEKCLSLIDTLPEVLMLARKIELSTKNFNRLTLWVAAKPSETKLKYYWVKAGEDNGDNIVTHLNFYVDPKTEEILFYDVAKDTLVSLEYWRENYNE